MLDQPTTERVEGGPRALHATAQHAVEVALDPLVINRDPSGLVCGTLAYSLYNKDMSMALGGSGPQFSTKQQLAHAQEMQGMSRENALSEFIRHQLHSLGERGELSRHLRIFNWEAVRPTAVYRKLMSEEAAPFMALAVDLVRRFLPKADQSTLIMAAVWLVGQCSIFVRNREQLANPPVSLALDGAAIERLTRLVSGWALAGLAAAA